MRLIYVDGIMVLFPTTEDVEGLEVGDMAYDCFGLEREVVRIFGRGVSVNGNAYVCYYTDSGTGSGSISNSLEANTLYRDVRLSMAHTSHELDGMERRLRVAVRHHLSRHARIDHLIVGDVK